MLASWQLSPRSFQLLWQEQCDGDISGKCKGKGAESAEPLSLGKCSQTSALVKLVSWPGAEMGQASVPCVLCGGCGSCSS